MPETTTAADVDHDDTTSRHWRRYTQSD